MNNIAHLCPSYPCPICHPERFWQTPNPGVPPVYNMPPPRGCVCPPTAEQTCQNETCPRKSMFAPPKQAVIPITGTCNDLNAPLSTS